MYGPSGLLLEMVAKGRRTSRETPRPGRNPICGSVTETSSFSGCIIRSRRPLWLYIDARPERLRKMITRQQVCAQIGAEDARALHDRAIAASSTPTYFLWFR